MEYVLDPSSGLPTPIGTPLTFATEDQFFAMAVSPNQQFPYVLSGDPEANTPVWPTIAVYAIDPSSGALTAGQSMTVQVNCNSIVIDPSGNYLYAVNTLNAGASQDTIQALTINQSSGVLSTTGPIIETDGQVISAGGIMFDPSGEFLYLVSMSEVNNETTGTALTTFTVSAASGSAGQLVPSGAPQQLPIGFGGWSIAIVE